MQHLRDAWRLWFQQVTLPEREPSTQQAVIDAILGTAKGLWVEARDQASWGYFLQVRYTEDARIMCWQREEFLSRALLSSSRDRTIVRAVLEASAQQALRYHLEQQARFEVILGVVS